MYGIYGILLSIFRGTQISLKDNDYFLKEWN